LAGDACQTEGETCDYDRPCIPQLSLGATMVCQHGYWERQDGLEFCGLML
jgi:hypothetical protein